MVTDDAIIQKIKELVGVVRTEKGSSIYLFMLIKMDEYIDRWTLFISADWIKEDTFSSDFRYIVQKIRTSLTQEEQDSISRIGLMTSDEYMVQLFTSSYSVFEENNPVRIENKQVNGYTVHDAYIFISRTPPEAGE